MSATCWEERGSFLFKAGGLIDLLVLLSVLLSEGDMIQLGQPSEGGNTSDMVTDIILEHVE